MFVHFQVCVLAFVYECKTGEKKKCRINTVIVSFFPLGWINILGTYVIGGMQLWKGH